MANHWSQDPSTSRGVSTAELEPRAAYGGPPPPPAGTQPGHQSQPGDPPPPEPERPDEYTTYQQIPAVLWKTDWTKTDVDNALRQHELGNFTASALLAEAMTRDDAFDAVLQTRVGGLLGLDRLITPATKGNKRGNKQIAQAVESRFDTMFPRHAMAQLLRWAILMGFAIAQIVWELNEDEDEWVPRLDVWHPIYTYVRLDTNQYFVYTTQGIVEVIPGTGQWLLYAPSGLRYAWFNGAIRSVAIPWLARQYAWRDWLRWSELYALGIRKALVPASADQKVKNKFYGQVANVGAAPTVLCEENETGKRFDLEVMWPDATNAAEGYEKLLNKCESKIAIRINGQNLTTEVKGGSFAAARVHENVKQDILQADSMTLGECLGRDVVTPYIGFHPYPAKTSTCTLGWITATPDDAKASAEKVGAVAKACVDFKTAQVPFDERALLARFDIDALPLGTPAPTLPAAPAGAPAPGASPTPAPTPAPAAPENDTDASSVTTSLSVAGGAHQKHAANGQAYVDELATKSASRARAALAPTVTRVKQAIANATDYTDLQHRLREVLHAKDDAQFAHLVEKTIVMAHLAGRHGVHKEHTSVE